MTAIAKTRRTTAQRYAELLAAVLPKPIETEAEKERALEMVNHLMTKGEKHLTSEERWLLRMLVRLIEDFEEKAYPMDEAPPCGGAEDADGGSWHETNRPGARPRKS